jgi:diaminohydroxyphosphoribosylaminopyrimidine deaminase/5-amino-6-(5-phosphoribosylamino)uracil reductase
MVQKFLKITCKPQLGYVCIMAHTQYMQRAIELALKGLGGVSPNPMVGCVIVYNDKIIGEGWHKKFGEAHAEVNAVNSVENKELLADSVFYITLEPCSFHGKTPACTDLILKYKPRSVVLASKDPNPHVNGHGVSILKNGGIEVIYGILEDESVAINRRYFVSMSQNRPYIVLKWAQTADGFIARNNYDSKWISNEQSRQLVHKWRSEEDAIVVGYNTVKYDDPMLTVRNWVGRNPIRVIIDPKLELDHSLKIFASDEKIYIINTISDQTAGNICHVKVRANNYLADMLAYLWEQNIGSLIIEGGAKSIKKFLAEGYWDEARIFTAESKFGEGIAAPSIELEPDQEQNIIGDRLSTIYNPKTKMLWQKK